MSSIKERYQNPSINETVRLRLFFYNANNFSNISSIEKIEIFKIEDGRSINDVDARTFVKSIPVVNVVNDGVGKYYCGCFA